MNRPFLFFKGLSFKKIKITALISILVCGLFLVLILYFCQKEIQADVVSEKYLPEVEFAETDFMLYVDKLSIKSPIIPDVDGANKEAYFAALQGGVAHMKGTPKPDENGNVVIFGHSNFYTNDPGLYKTIFAQLNELVSGDGIRIRYLGSDYFYQVEEQKIVEPDEVWVINASYDLTLVTCWPPGSIEKRMVIFANKKT